MKEMKILSPTGIVGYGFPESSFKAGAAQCPDLIAADAGSSDPGPYYLGSGNSFTTRSAVKRDLGLMIKAGRELNIPVVIGSAGGSGGKPHLERETQIILEIAEENNLSFKLTTIDSELDKHFLINQLKNGKIKQLGAAPPINENDISESVRIVAQMGVEPIITALQNGADVVLCGRCYDPAVFAAPAIIKGYPKAFALHLGKLLECSAMAATPGSAADCMMGYLGDDYFRIEPISPKRKCTTTSVAAHTLYEKSNPYILYGPGGVLDLSNCEFTQVNDRCVKVTGTKYTKDQQETVKLEGSKRIGYRSISIAGNRDPIFIANLDKILHDIRISVNDNLSGINLDYDLDFIVYGKNGVMGSLEPIKEITSHEVGIIIDVVAETQELATTVCSVTRSTFLHHGYEGRISTGGNLAFPYSPSDIKCGEVYNFSVYGLLETDEPGSLFPMTEYKITKGTVK